MNPVKFVMEFFLMREDSVIAKEQGILDFFFKDWLRQEFPVQRKRIVVFIQFTHLSDG